MGGERPKGFFSKVKEQKKFEGDLPVLKYSCSSKQKVANVPICTGVLGTCSWTFFRCGQWATCFHQHLVINKPEKQSKDWVMDNKYEGFILGLFCLDWGSFAYQIIKTELKELLSILIAVCRNKVVLLPSPHKNQIIPIFWGSLLSTSNMLFIPSDLQYSCVLP